MDYVMNAPRLDIISANKEGLISLTGRHNYQVLYILLLTYSRLHFHPLNWTLYRDYCAPALAGLLP